MHVCIESTTTKTGLSSSSARSTSSSRRAQRTSTLLAGSPSRSARARICAPIPPPKRRGRGPSCRPTPPPAKEVSTSRYRAPRRRGWRIASSPRRRAPVDSSMPVEGARRPGVYRRKRHRPAPPPLARAGPWAPASSTTTSSRLFHSPQSGHLPSHRGWVYPQ
jgi:hypothetical protein